MGKAKKLVKWISSTVTSVDFLAFKVRPREMRIVAIDWFAGNKLTVFEINVGENGDGAVMAHKDMLHYEYYTANKTNASYVTNIPIDMDYVVLQTNVHNQTGGTILKLVVTIEPNE